MDRNAVSNKISQGGTFLKSARLPEFKEKAVQKKAVEILKAHGIGYLIVIGGDGSFRGASALSELGIKTVALPGTIDNDMSYTDLTIGYLTACETCMDAIDKLRDTMSSHNRLCIVEVMGRNCGDIAIRSAIASGANYLVTHETGLDVDKICKAAVRTRNLGKEHCMIVITENLCNIDELAKTVQERTGWDSRAVVLGHIQRGGSPIVEDRTLASVLAYRAAELISKDISNRAVGVRNNNVVDYDIEKALKIPKKELTDYIEVFEHIV